MGYNNRNGNNNRNNNNRGGKFNNSAAAAERQKKNEEVIARQTRDLASIKAVCSYLNNYIKSPLADGERYKKKISIKELMAGITEVSAENLKFISQYSYILIDLANAQIDNRITMDQLVIKIRYCADRFYIGFRDQFCSDIEAIILSNEELFGVPATEEEVKAMEEHENASTTEEA